VRPVLPHRTGRRHRVTVGARLAALAKNDSIVPIPGSPNTGRVTENVAAVELTLTADDLSRIGEIAPEGGVGGRFD
jgi:aryl-alcohol dehydrogenase-like predicted oxidoreductase